MSKILIINGSPHQNGSTQRGIEEITQILEQEDFAYDVLSLSNQVIESCRSCGFCKTNPHCIIDDLVNPTFDKLDDYDGFILASPVHYSGLSGSITSFLGRLYYIGSQKMSYKPCANFVVARRGGTTAALEQLNQFPLINNQPLVASQYWNCVHASVPKDLDQDQEGLQILRQLARNLVWQVKSLEIAKDSGLPKPKSEDRIWTNFVPKTQ